MAKYWLVQLNTGRLVELKETSEDLDGQAFASKGAANEQRWMAVPEGIAPGNCKLDVDNADPENPVYSIIDGSADTSGPLWDELRRKRDLLLADSDKKMLVDNYNAMSAQDQTDWAAYRSYLKDIPQNESDPEMEPMDFDSWLAAQGE